MNPYDEPEIECNSKIIRRINPEQHVVPDNNTGGERISTKAFSISSGVNAGMSVDILHLIEGAGKDAHVYVTTPIYTASVIFPAGAARDVGLWVGYDPIASNPFHGEVWTTPPHGRFSRSQRRSLLMASEWFVEIPNVTLNP